MTRMATLTSILVAAAVLTPVAAAAETRGVEIGWVDPHPQSELVDTFDDFLVSGDLRTAVFDECATESGTLGLTFVDLETAATSVVSGAPDRPCVETRQDLGPPLGPPHVTSLNAVSHEGVVLATASWEGVTDGDGDGGATDAFLVDPADGSIRLLSGSLADRTVRGRALSDDASRAVLLSTNAADDGDMRLHLWDRGAVTSIDVPAAFDLEVSRFEAWLSGDGRFSFVTVIEKGSESAPDELRLLRVDLSDGSTSHTALTATCCGLRRLAVSRDGGTAAWVGAPEPGAIFGDRITTWNVASGETTDHLVPGGSFQSTPIHVGDDGSAVVGASRFTSVGEDRGYLMWRLDVERKVFTSLIDERPNGGSWMVVKAVSPDGSQAVVSTMGPVGFEPASPEVVQFGRLATRQYLWDASLTPPPHPASDPTVSAAVERLYLAMLGRPSDGPGRAHWVDVVVAGRPLADVAAQFAKSDEFTQRYGPLDDEAFLELVYDNMFGRAPDSVGAAFWLQLLAADTTRGDVVAAISQSPEYIEVSGTDPPRSPGEASLRRLYAAVFLRAADDPGIAYWLGQLADGATLDDASAAFIASSEFDRAYGSLDDRRFVAVVYLNVLGRYPDPAGGDFWAARLADGLSRGSLVLALSESPEFVDLTTKR